MRLGLLALIGGAVGLLVGLPMGVVGYGSGWNGAVVFGPMGALMGLLTGLATRSK